jgi:hypothetical protein
MNIKNIGKDTPFSKIGEMFCPIFITFVPV